MVRYLSLATAALAAMVYATALPANAVTQQAQPHSTLSGHDIINCFRVVTNVPAGQEGARACKLIHAGTNMWGCFTRGGLADDGIFQFPLVGFGWSCPPDKASDWAVKDANGSIVYASQTPTACYNSPFRDYALAKTEDFVRKHPRANALLLDALWWGTMGYDRADWCCCDWCKKAYKDRFGREMPLGPSWANPKEMRECIEWRRDTLEQFYKEVMARVRAIRPDILFNIHGGSSWHLDAGNLFSRISCQRLSDIAYMENYRDEVFYAAFLRGISHRRTMLHLPYVSDAAHVHDPIAGYSDDEYNAVASGLVAHGCIPVMFVRWNGDGSLSKSYVRLLEPIYKEIEEKEPYLVDAVPVTYAAIVYSEATKTYYRRDDPAKSILPHLEGAFQMLQRLQVPVEFLLAELDLNLETLRKYRVIILPNVAMLSPPQVRALKEYVREGGSILATYETGLYDELGERKADFDLAEVFGLSYVEGRPGDYVTGAGAYLAPRDSFLKRLQEMLAPRQDESLHATSPAAITRATAGKSRALLVPRGEMSAYCSDNKAAIPGVHTNTYGKGKAAYIAAPIYKLIKTTQVTNPYLQPAKTHPMVAFARRDGWVVDMTRELLDELAPNPPIRVEGPFHLECTFFEQKDKNRVIVHLLNSTVRDLGKVYPIGPARILVSKDFARPGKAYSVWPKGQALRVRDKGSYLEITTPTTAVHQIVVIERERAGGG